MAAERDQQQPSYPAQVSITSSLAPTEFTFEAVCGDPSAVQAVIQATTAFERAIRVGMFSTRIAEQGSLIETDLMNPTDDPRVRCVWRTTDLQPAAFRVLLEMLETIHRFSGPVESVRLLGRSTAPGHLLDVRHIWHGGFPSRVEQTPFPMMLKHRLDESEEPLVRLEFDRDVVDSEFQAVAQALLAWDTLVVRGGYFHQVGDWEPRDVDESLSDAQTYLAAPNTIEHLLYEFIGAAAAFDALINMAARFHYLLHPLATFSVE
jgi:hypothetical protein